MRLWDAAYLWVYFRWPLESLKFTQSHLELCRMHLVNFHKVFLCTLNMIITHWQKKIPADEKNLLKSVQRNKQDTPRSCNFNSSTYRINITSFPNLETSNVSQCWFYWPGSEKPRKYNGVEKCAKMPRQVIAVISLWIFTWTQHGEKNTDALVSYGLLSIYEGKGTRTTAMLSI